MELIRHIPTELHIHIEGSLEPELMFAIAERNNVTLPYDSVEALRAAYQFSNLQSFLDIYYAGTCVLLYYQDFDVWTHEWDCQAVDGKMASPIAMNLA